MKNQCDGCNRGLPVERGLHVDKGHPVMGCVKHLYEEQREVINGDLTPCRECWSVRCNGECSGDGAMGD